MPAAISELDFPCAVASNHPQLGSKPLKWKAKAVRLDSDIMVIRDGLPALAEIPALAEKHAALFNTTTIINNDQTEYANRDHRRTDRLTLSRSDVPEDLLLYSMVCRTMEATFITTYVKLVNSHALVSTCSGYDLLRYRQGDFFKEHVDTAKDHPVLGHRRLSFVAFCNGDFEGGTLFFPRQQVAIKPEPGLVAIFPSSFTHPHESTPVVSGTKYSIVSWFF